MITYRNPLWDTIIVFLKELKDYPPFQEVSNGKIKQTVESIYNRACKHARITDTDWKTLLLTRVLPYLNEKDLEPDAYEVFKHIEETNFDKFCFNTKDGVELFNSAKKEMEDFKNKKDKQAEFENQYMQYIAKKEAHEKFLEEQEKTRRELEEAEKKLEMIQKCLIQENKEEIVQENKEEYIVEEQLTETKKIKKQKTTGAENEPAGDKEIL